MSRCDLVYFVRQLGLHRLSHISLPSSYSKSKQLMWVQSLAKEVIQRLSLTFDSSFLYDGTVHDILTSIDSTIRRLQGTQSAWKVQWLTWRQVIYLGLHRLRQSLFSYYGDHTGHGVFTTRRMKQKAQMSKNPSIRTPQSSR